MDCFITYIGTKNGNSEQVKEIFIKIREENLGKIHLSANGGKVVISGITSTLIRMCNNMAESMETEQLLEKVQTEQSFSQSIGSIGNTVPASMRRKLSQQEQKERDILSETGRISGEKLWQSISGRPHGGRRVWTIRKLFFYLFQGDDGKIF